MKSKIVLLASVLAVFVMINVYAGGRRDAGERTRTDRLIVAYAADPISLDPVMSNSTPDLTVMSLIYSTLTHLDYDLVPQPGLAYRWSWDAPDRLRLFLRRDVRFHNGDLMTAADVKFSLERAAASPFVSHLAGMIRSVDIINDFEVAVNTHGPFAPLLNNLGLVALSVVNERHVRAVGDEGSMRNPIGSGPYRFVSRVAGDRLEFVRFENYFGPPAKIPNLTIRIITDDATRLLELETGGVDIIQRIQPSDISRVENHPHMTLHREMNLAVNFIGMNLSRPPFNDLRVRQAIAHAIDLDAMVRAVYMGTGSVATGPINPRVWASIADELPRIPFNPARSRQLLAEAGFPNGFHTTFITNENAVRIDTGEILQNMLAQVGITMDVRILEWGAILDTTARGDHEMFMLGWVTLTGDPDYGLYSTFHSRNHGEPGNRAFYTNHEVDRLLDAGRRETDPARRRELYAQAQRIIHSEIPWIWQQFGEELFASRHDVRGFRINPTMFHRLQDVYFATP